MIFTALIIGLAVGIVSVCVGVIAARDGEPI